MKKICIEHRDGIRDSFQALITFDGEEEDTVSISNPFSEDDEKSLEYYFEFHDKTFHPEKINAYGEELFAQIFRNNNEVRQEYENRKLPSEMSQWSVEIVGPPEFHALHWETLKDPDHPIPWSVESAMTHRDSKQCAEISVKSSPIINLLFISARPGGDKDVDFYAISRPLLEEVCQRGEMNLNIHILRSGTYEELSRHLEERKDYYHIIHFDVHGKVLTYQRLEREIREGKILCKGRYGRRSIGAHEGTEAYLFMEGTPQNPIDVVSARELADLLCRRRIPIAIFNACQSGKEEKEGEDIGASLASRLTEAGVQMVLAMRYSVTTRAAVLMMLTLYENLLAKKSLSDAIRLARLELWSDTLREDFDNRTIDLKDWMLPIVYKTSEEYPLRVVPFKNEDWEKYSDHFSKLAHLYAFPRPFFGRGSDIREIEKKLLSSDNLLLLHGAPGVGKTTLLNYLRVWWPVTGLVKQVFYFGYDEAKVWNCQQIISQVAGRSFREAPEKAKRLKVLNLLKSERHLLILDNMECVTNKDSDTFSENEPQEIRDFLVSLSRGKTLVIIGSRDAQKWTKSVGNNVHKLTGLDSKSVSDLADYLLKNTDYSCRDTDCQDLLEYLGGNPLLLEMLLPRLKDESPAEILQSLKKDGSDDVISEDAFSESDNGSEQSMGDEQMNFEQKAALVDALLSCETMKNRSGRDSVADNLPDDIRNNIQTGNNARTDVLNIVSISEKYRDGITKLINVVRFHEGSSRGMEKVDEVVRSIYGAEEK